jgi:hypothetical protein
MISAPMQTYLGLNPSQSTLKTLLPSSARELVQKVIPQLRSDNWWFEKHTTNLVQGNIII